MSDTPHEIPDSGDLPSRSQKKRDAQDTLALASRLIDTPNAILDGLPLDASLRDLIERVRNIRAHVARKRELQFLAKHLRQIDSVAVGAQLDDYLSGQLTIRHQQHHIEAWRDRLMQDGVKAVNQLSAHCRSLPRPALIDLIRQIQSLQASADAAPVERLKSLQRKLFEQLKSVNEIEPLPECD